MAFNIRKNSGEPQRRSRSTWPSRSNSLRTGKISGNLQASGPFSAFSGCNYAAILRCWTPFPVLSRIREFSPPDQGIYPSEQGLAGRATQNKAEVVPRLIERRGPAAVRTFATDELGPNKSAYYRTIDLSMAAKSCVDLRKTDRRH